MRKITILEVLDPVKNEFVPIRQAINQGLFNTKTYLFFNPIENKHYSITEAARRGLFKSAIDLRPEALIVERIKVAQTVFLLSARDPSNNNKLISIQEAIEKGIVDPNFKIYRNTENNQVIELGDAIDSDLIQVKIVRETTEKITETLTEQKNPDNPGLIKKVETQSTNTNFAQEDLDGIKRLNGNYLFDRTKSLSINKMMKKYDDDIAAGFISDLDTNKIINQSELKTLNPVIDFNDAVSKNIVILPDSLCLTQNVQYVVDLENGNKFDFEAACEIGLIDVKNRRFFDTKQKKFLNLFEALGKNYIVMRDELNNNYDEDKLLEEDFSKKKPESINFNDIKSMFDPLTGEQVVLKKAIELGILSKSRQEYVDTASGKRISLEDAVQKGLVVLKLDKTQNKDNNYQFLHIKGVFNPLTKSEMSLKEAISAGFLDYSECEFHDPLSGKTLTLLDAYDKGYLITSPSHNDTEINDENISKVDNSFVYERPSQAISTEPVKKPDQLPPPKQRLPKSQSISPQRSQTMSSIKQNPRSSSQYSIKTMDKMSTNSKKSVISKLKEKMVGKKSKSNRFDENLIRQSIKIYDNQLKKIYTLEEAVNLELLIPEDRVKDKLNQTDYSIEDGVRKGLVKFFHPINNFEFKYEQSCYIFNNEYLLLVNYVIDPITQRKIGLKTAFSKQIIDPNNSVYFKKKPINLPIAIDRGYLSCEIIDLGLLNSIITSAIFKNHTPITQDQAKVESKPQIMSRNVLDSRDELKPENEIKVEKLDFSTLNKNQEELKINEEDGLILSKNLLEQSGISYDENKKYFISEVFDSDKNKYVKFKKALYLGLINLDKQEYIDSRTGNLKSLSLAIRNGNIKIEDINSSYIDSGDDLDIITSSNYADLDTTIETIKDPEIKPEIMTSTLKNGFDLNLEQKKANTEPLSYDSFTSSINSKVNGINSSKSSYISEMVSNYQSENFDLLKCLLYKKSSNGKYIRFERVVRNGFYDFKSGKIKDMSTNELYGLNEALAKGLMRINDSNVLFDSSNIYIIDSALLNSRKIKLNDAIEKGIVDRYKCTYRFLSNTYSIKDAMKQGLIEGSILTGLETKYLLEDYASRIESKMSFNRSKTETDLDDIEHNSTLKNSESFYAQIRNDISIPKSIEKFNDFFIYDPKAEAYVSMNDAYYQGIILNDPIRVKDPSNNKHILLKDAVIKGLISCQKSDERIDFAKNRSSFYTFNRTSYLIDYIYDSRKLKKYSLQEAIKVGLFANGIYRNFLKSEQLQIDEAINQGYIIGKRVDLEEIESSFKVSLGGRYEINKSKPPSKPTRGIFVQEEEIVSIKDNTQLKQRGLKSRSKSNDKRKKFGSENTITRSKIEPFSGRIVSVQDLRSGKYVKPDIAERDGLINFVNGTFKNSLTDEILKINEAMERGYILVDSNREIRKRSLSEKSNRTLRPVKYESDDIIDTPRIEMNQEFRIISVLDPIKMQYLDLEQAIKTGIFDVSTAMYIDPRTKKRLTLVDAIDQNIIKIDDKNFKPSFKLVIEESDKNLVKNLKSLSIRYIVDSYSQLIIPLNLAVSKKLVNLETGTYSGYEKRLTLKEAYDKCLVFTCDDLDNPNSKRAKFVLAGARKSTTAKAMSSKSALAKNWVNWDRRLYLDKQTNQDIPFSQAIDMDYLLLRSNLTQNLTNSKSLSSIYNTNKSRDKFLNNPSDYNLNSKLSSSKY